MSQPTTIFLMQNSQGASQTLHLSHNNNFFLKLYIFKNSIIFLAEVILKVFVPSKRPSVTHLVINQLLKSLSQREICHAFLLPSKDQHLMLQDYIMPKLVKHITIQFFFNNLRNISCENCFLEGKINFGHKCKHGTSSTNFQQIVWANDFNNQQAHILEKINLLHIIFLKMFFWQKKIDNCIHQ